MSEETLEPQTARESVEHAADKIASLLTPQEPEQEPEPAPTVEAEPEPQQDQLQQTQQQLASYQNQLIQEQQALQAEEQSIKGIRQTDPAEYAAAMADLMQKKEAHTYKAAQLQNYIQQFDSQYSEKALKTHQQKLDNDRKYLEGKIGYTDEKGKQISAYLRKQGLTNQQIAMLDAKSIEAHYRAMQSQKQKTLPQKKPKVDKRAQAEREIQRRNLGSGTLQAAQERIMAMGLVK
jgi:hypothetical protein